MALRFRDKPLQWRQTKAVRVILGQVVSVLVIAKQSRLIGKNNRIIVIVDCFGINPRNNVKPMSCRVFPKGMYRVMSAYYFA